MTPIDKDIPLCKGSLAYTDDLGRVLWPAKFRPDLPRHYNDKANPVEFIQLYTLAVHVAGDDEKAMANWSPMALHDTPRRWLMNLPSLSISI